MLLGAGCMKSLDQHFHLQKLPMFFIGQGLMALALFVRGTEMPVAVLGVY